MPDVLLDSNIVVDLLTTGSDWHAWSIARVVEIAAAHALILSPIVYAEVAAGFASEDVASARLDSLLLRREDLPWPAAYLAGQVHRTYRARGGARTSTLPDFFIGAHALVKGHTLLTRDARRYRTYFPDLRLIAPD